MKYYIIAGEASGDLHGSNLIKGLKKSDPEAHFRVWGGDLMQQAGGELVRHYKETAVMGFVEVLMHASKIKKNFDAEGITIPFPQQDVHLYPEMQKK